LTNDTFIYSVTVNVMPITSQENVVIINKILKKKCRAINENMN